MNFLNISLPFLHDYGVKMGDVNNPCTTNFAPSYGARGEEISPKKPLTLRIFVGCHAFVGEERCVTTKSVRKHNKMTQFQCQPNIFSFPLKNIKNQNNSSRQTNKQTSCSLEFYGEVKVQVTSNRDVTDRWRVYPSEENNWFWIYRKRVYGHQNEILERVRGGLRRYVCTHQNMIWSKHPTSGLDLKTENHEVKCKHLAGGSQAYNTVFNLHLTDSGLP